MDRLRNLFDNRRDAGKKLAGFLKNLQFENPVILALPRGGVVVADEIAEKLHLSLDVVIARKIGAPGHPEYGIGAISENEEPSFNSSVASFYNPDSSEIKETVQEETSELHRRKELYRGGHDLPDMKDKTVIVVDDGLATGVTAVAAAKFLRTLQPKELVLAVPVGPSDVGKEVEENYDQVICLHSLPNLRGVGLWYEDFDQVEDDEVLKILKKYH